MKERSNMGKIVFFIFSILLFGIGFVGVCSAQENRIVINDPNLKFGTNPSTPLKVDIQEKKEYNKQIDLNKFLELYDKYAKECYADSSFVRVHEPEMIKMHGSYIPKEFCLVDWVCMTESHYKNKWIHKQPTFKEFIEWLKKQ